jgi:hypothetical protein
VSATLRCGRATVRIERRTPGYRAGMVDPRLEDHAVGVELQIVDLVERRERASAQGRIDDASQLQAQIDSLHSELARTADVIASQA